jgi:transposase
VTSADQEAILAAMRAREAAERREREAILAAHIEHGASFRELSKLTGYAQTTIQRWKREAT